MKKNIIIFGILLIVVLTYSYVYQDHRDIEKEKAEFTLDADLIIKEFSMNSQSSETKYLNKTIEVEGYVTNQSEKSISLNENIFCQFNELFPSKLKADTEIKIKGRFIGYDDLLEELKFDQCKVVSSK